MISAGLLECHLSPHSVVYIFLSLEDESTDNRQAAAGPALTIEEDRWWFPFYKVSTEYSEELCGCAFRFVLTHHIQDI